MMCPCKQSAFATQMCALSLGPVGASTNKPRAQRQTAAVDVDAKVEAAAVDAAVDALCVIQKRALGTTARPKQQRVCRTTPAD